MINSKTIRKSNHLTQNILFAFQDVGATSNAYGAAILTGLLRTAGTFGGTLLLMRGVPRKVSFYYEFLFDKG